MFVTAFIWGIGVSCGACGGLLLFAVLKALLDRITGKAAYDTMLEYNRKVLAALIDRNEMTELMVEHLEHLGTIAESMKEKERR